MNHCLWEIPCLLQALQKKSTSPDGAPPNQKIEKSNFTKTFEKVSAKVERNSQI
jgi:hypothetical protein